MSDYTTWDDDDDLDIPDQICPLCNVDMEFCTCDDGDVYDDERVCEACNGTGVDKYDLLSCRECNGRGWIEEL